MANINRQSYLCAFSFIMALLQLSSCHHPASVEEQQLLDLVNRLLYNSCGISSSETEEDIEYSPIKTLKYGKISHKDVRLITSIGFDGYCPTVEEMQILSKLKYLSVLGFGSSGVSDEHLKVIADKMHNITQMSFTNETFTEESGKHLARIKKLRNFALFEMKMTDDCLKHFSNPNRRC